MLKPETKPLTEVSATAAPSYHHEARDELRALIDRFALLVPTLGLLAIALSVLRITSSGITTNIVSDVITYIAFVVLIFIRKKLPTRLLLALLFGVAGVCALVNFFTLGLVTVGFVILSAIVVVAGSAFNMRSGVIALVAGIIPVTIIGMLVISGKAPGARIKPSYLLSMQTWLMQIAAYTVYTMAMLVAVNAIQQRLGRSLAETRRQSEELKEREKKYRLLAENMLDVIVTQDMERRFTYVSPSAERLFGYTTEEARSLTLADVIAPESLEKAVSIFQSHLAHARAGDFHYTPLLELEYVRKDGTRFWGEFKPAFIFDGAGTIIGTQGLLRDISERKTAEQERKAMEEQLFQSEKLQAIGRLAGGVAHDFNNQLTGIMTYAEMLKLKVPENPHVAEYAENILSPAKRAAELTAKLLAFARKGNYNAGPVSIHTAITETIVLLKHSISKAIRIVCHFEAESDTVTGDATQLQSAILNIALNARDAMPDGGILTIATRTLPAAQAGLKGTDAIEVTVTDTGSGIDQSILPHIFEPFFTTKAIGKGSGLGLAAVYGTVKSHSGTIAVKSEPGSGAVFTLCFPLADQRSKPEDSQTSLAAKPGKGTIMVIDDEPIVAQSLTTMLTFLGYESYSLPNARQAIDKYRQTLKETDLIIQDLMLPDMSGENLFGELLAINPGARILLVSGYSLDANIRKMLDRGAAGFLRKPFNTVEFSLKIAECLAAR